MNQVASVPFCSSWFKSLRRIALTHEYKVYARVVMVTHAYYGVTYLVVAVHLVEYYVEIYRRVG